ncbi:MAG: hypothetical protein ACYSU1_08385 [Planctomycetota bacterium]|jgi:hypothetical protein
MKAVDFAGDAVRAATLGESGAPPTTRQDPLQDLGPPELPGVVEAMPLDSWIPVLWVLAAGVLVWLMIRKLHESGAARRRRLAAQVLSAADHRTPREVLQVLRACLDSLSEEQQAEARALSGLLRSACGSRRGADFSSATDAQLLRHMQVADPQEPSDADQATLIGALRFVSGILFAGQRPSTGVWEAQLKEVEGWLEYSSADDHRRGTEI